MELCASCYENGEGKNVHANVRHMGDDSPLTRQLYGNTQSLYNIRILVSRARSSVTGKVLYAKSYRIFGLKVNGAVAGRNNQWGQTANAWKILSTNTWNM